MKIICEPLEFFNEKTQDIGKLISYAKNIFNVRNNQSENTSKSRCVCTHYLVKMVAMFCCDAIERDAYFNRISEVTEVDKSALRMECDRISRDKEHGYNRSIKKYSELKEELDSLKRRIEELGTINLRNYDN